MSVVTDHRPALSDAHVSGAEVRDFIALLKPRVMTLVVFTAFVGIMIAPGQMHPVLKAVSVLMIAIGGGAAGALNMWYEADVDRLMTRTRTRPIPRGAITPDEALAFGLTLSAASVICLGLFTNWVAAGLLAFTIFFYVVVYTIWLKRRTPQNIVIGGAAGAFPPMIGWAAVTGSVSIESIIMFSIIFMWTPPHFWALALYKCGDYGRAGIPMLPNVAGPDETRRQILIYTALYLPLTLAPALLGFAGTTYLAGAGVLAAFFGYFAWRVFRIREGEAADKAAKHLFAFSILQLLLVFVLLLVDGHAIQGALS